MFKNVELENVKRWANERFFNNDPRHLLSAPNAEFDLFCKYMDSFDVNKSDGENQFRDSDLSGIFYQHFEQLKEKGLIDAYLK